MGLFRMLTVTFSEINETIDRTPSHSEINRFEDSVDNIFIYSLIWSFGIRFEPQ